YVTITWDASRSDTYAGGVVTSYAVYRSLTGPPSYNWQSRGSFIAVHQETYTYTDDTTADSTASGPAYHYYKVRAFTSIVDLYWDSLPDSGYSVDNTAPASPAAVAGEQRTDPPGLEITWLPNTDSDLAHYAVYRGTGSGFVPSLENRVGTPDEPVYFDGEWRWNTGCCYKVTAVDVHDNESAPASLLPDDVTGAGTRGASFSNALYQNVPNPFNPSTRIRFEIQTASDVTLRVYDANGKLVHELVNARLAPGRYEEEWSGRTLGARRAASGVYFYKLTAGSFVETKKMILLK
ncbi:MAG: T9SS type A sorting domain-containing protein, partial [bacterium]